MRPPEPGLKRSLGLIAAGGVLPLSFAPFDFWPAAFVGVGLAFWLLQDHRDWRSGFFSGWLIGVGKYAIGASWIYVSIHEQGGASESLASVLVGVFVAGMALFSALFGVLYALCAPNSNSSNPPPGSATKTALMSAAVFAASWCLAEWSLTWLLTGFPWLFVGYGLMPTWFSEFAPVTGVFGLSFLVCFLAALGVTALRGTPGLRLAFLVAALALFAGGYGLGKVNWVRLGAAGEVALVQGNIEQLTKWEPANRLPILKTYESLSEPHWGADLIVWPEAALTLFAEQATPWLERWTERGQTSGTTLVLGLPDYAELTGTDEFAFQNTAVALGSGSGRYVKQRLVPFGEYVPLEALLRGLISFFDLPMSRSSAGPADQPPLSAHTRLGTGSQTGSVRPPDTRLGMAICYEIAYPELVRASAMNSDVLVTISNDAWFGASIGPHQHLQLARMRALENGRYVLRSTNNGLTAIINERGVVTAILPAFEPGVLRGRYAKAEGQTPFNRLGNWPVLVLLAGILGIGLVRRRWYIAAPLK